MDSNSHIGSKFCNHLPSSRAPTSFIQVLKTWKSRIIFFSIEPIGLTKPKFSSIVYSSAFIKSLSQSFAITCPAQGLPLPSFRYLRLESLKLFKFFHRTYWINQTEIYIHCWFFRIQKVNGSKFCYNLPGSRAPASIIQVLLLHDLKNQKDVPIFLEPIGMSLPKFSTTSDTLGSFKSKIGKSFSLLCPAQGKPIPAFRWVVLIHILYQSQLLP